MLNWCFPFPRKWNHKPIQSPTYQFTFATCVFCENLHYSEIKSPWLSSTAKKKRAAFSQSWWEIHVPRAWSETVRGGVAAGSSNITWPSRIGCCNDANVLNPHIICDPCLHNCQVEAGIHRRTLQMRHLSLQTRFKIASEVKKSQFWKNWSISMWFEQYLYLSFLFEQ